MDELLMVAFR